MLDAARGLTPTQLDAVADLERAVLAVDGGRLKLEWGTLRGRSGDRVEDLLWWEDGELLGFVGLYAFGFGPVELSGMVRPDARRRGIATALLDEALRLCAARGVARVLLVAPRSSDGARAMAVRRAAELDHSEYALRLDADPVPGRSDPRITLRPLVAGDVPRVDALLREAFGHGSAGVADTLIVDLDGETVGTLRVDHDDEGVGVYGFAVAAEHRGRGIGRDVLRRACRRARADGLPVHLEVAADNDHALALYTSLGFAAVATEDYYDLPLPPRRP